MNWVDVAVLVLVAFSGMLGFFRGLVREVLGLAAWVGAAVLAVTFNQPAQDFTHRFIPNPDIMLPVAFFVPFLVTLVVLSLIARVMGGAARKSALGGLDRTLGLLFGVARGAALLIAAYFIAGVLQPVDQWPDPVLEARTLPSIYLGAAWVVQRVPVEYRPSLPVPPPGRQAGSADLLHANPVDRATGPAPAR